MQGTTRQSTQLRELSQVQSLDVHSIRTEPILFTEETRRILDHLTLLEEERRDHLDQYLQDEIRRDNDFEDLRSQ
jgi:hypothetical protein